MHAGTCGKCRKRRAGENSGRSVHRCEYVIGQEFCFRGCYRLPVARFGVFHQPPFGSLNGPQSP